jgi:hypothetical protein
MKRLPLLLLFAAILLLLAACGCLDPSVPCIPCI